MSNDMVAKLKKFDEFLSKLNPVTENEMFGLLTGQFIGVRYFYDKDKGVRHEMVEGEFLPRESESGKVKQWE